ncbi:MAG: c-type cytochrome [Chromatiales bacterium]|nr:c-type cytochrome [Chromatiales bacterium]
MSLIRRTIAVGILSFSAVLEIEAQPTVAIDVASQERIKKELEQRIQSLKSDPKKLKELREEGQSRTVLCRTCHGKDGISVKELVPNLAGQNPVYIVDQFQRFSDGRRFDYLMSGLAKSFSDEERINIALYYSSLDKQLGGGVDSPLLPEGKTVYNEICAECHGTDGQGQEGYAMLAGQRQDYVLKMLKEFRDRTGRRSNPWMSAVALRLSDQQMEAVAAYITNLK